MNSASKIQRAHLERLAIVYVRQSSLAQVYGHTESTARQYALADDATRLGWEASRIVVIDADLGISGRTASARAGFRELVGRVCVGEVGAIFGLEVSRLARSSADLQRLLELCSLSDTLIIDSDGTYDLAQFNDRLLLGLKGTMSEAELHLLTGRLHGAKQTAAGRGALRFPLPVGYVYDEARATVLDPDEEIQAAVRDLFAAFVATGSAYGVVGAFAKRRFPRRAYGGAWAGDIRWGRLTHGRVLSVLANPAYAGAYVFGRYRSRRTLTPDGTIRTKLISLPLPEWAVLIRDHHPGYISWEAYLANRERVAAHCTHHGARPEREGRALCQGIVRCGACGRGMTTTYPAGKPAYDCSRTRSDHTKTPGCRSVLAAMVDAVVVQRLLQVVAPEEIALALAAADEVADRHARSRRALELRVERARYDAARAERAFHRCDPDHRLVARSLEPRWETQLKELVEAERELMWDTRKSPIPPREEIEALARDLPRLWAAPTTSAKDRKRLVRSLVADVTLRSEPAGARLGIGIRWRSGAAEEVVTHRGKSAVESRRTSADVVALVARLAPERTDAEIADALNAEGRTTGTGRPFDVEAVRWVRFTQRIRSRPLLAPGELTVDQVATHLGISASAVYYWIDHGQLEARRGPAGRLCVPFSSEVARTCRERTASSRHLPRRTQNVLQEALV
jgi:DNA invertase Pin-like site-specific DNA recombinase